MTASFFRRLSVFAVAACLMGPPTFAKNSAEITQFGHDIRIAEDQQADVVTCFGCSVYVRGQVAGEITTFYGNIVIEGNANVGGEVTSLLGDVRMDEGTQVAGEVTVMGGRLRHPPASKIAGDVTVFESRGLVYVILLSPFLVLAGIIALIVWLVRRRRPRQVYARAA